MANKNYNNYSKKTKPAATENKEAEITVNETPKTPDVQTGVVVNCEKLNIRNKPSIDGVILGTLSKGDEVVIHEIVKSYSGKDFYKVKVDVIKPDEYQYCMAKYIKINN